MKQSQMFLDKNSLSATILIAMEISTIGTMSPIKGDCIVTVSNILTNKRGNNK